MAPSSGPRPHLPGFFYDVEAERYFKIDSKAPASSPYSLAGVKRRKKEETEQKKAQYARTLQSQRVRRSRVLADAATGGILAREPGGSSREDMAISCWATGVEEKGTISMWPELSENKTAPNIRHFYVDGQDTRTGLGVAYGCHNGSDVFGSYIPRDDVGNIDFKNARDKWPRVDFLPKRESVRSPSLAALSYHQPSNKVIMVSTEQFNAIGLRCFSPTTLASEPEMDGLPDWTVGGADYYQNFKLNYPPHGCDCEANAFAPCQASGSLAGLIGTSQGLACFRTEGGLQVVDWPETHNSPNSRDILSIDFLRHQGSGVTPEAALVGCRSGHIWAADFRARPNDWLGMRQNYPICHLRSLDEHHVLAAGPSNSMFVYDLRWLEKDKFRSMDKDMANTPSRDAYQQSSHRKRKHGKQPERIRNEEERRANPRRSSTKPVLRFPDFKNNAQMQFGLDVYHDYNLAASAHDDGTVALYSTKTGLRLRAPAVDDGAIGNRTGTVRSLMFQTMPNDMHPSLFVGVGPDVKMFSWGLPRGQVEEWTVQ